MEEEEIIKAIETAKEIDRIAMNGEASKASHLYQFVTKHPAEAELLTEQLRDESRLKFMADKMNSMNKEYDIARLIQAVDGKRKKRNRIILITATSSAAALLIVSFLIFYTLLRPTEIEECIVAATKATVPLLVTDKGERINLNKVKNELTTSDYQILKKDSNSVVMLKIEKVEKQSEVQYNELIIPVKYQYLVEMSDGTIVTLNAGSRLLYPTEFEGEERKVELHGEGYFEVAKADNPFVVIVNGLRVKVYGTKFNIKTRSNGNVETFLVEGSVGLSSDLMPEVRLAPNQLALYDAKTASATLKERCASDQIQWLENYFKYSNEPIKNVLNDLSAWYGLDFSVKGDVEGIKLTFFISRDLLHHEVFHFIETLADVKFIREGGSSYTICQ